MNIGSLTIHLSKMLSFQRDYRMVSDKVSSTIYMFWKFKRVKGSHHWPLDSQVDLLVRSDDWEGIGFLVNQRIMDPLVHCR